MKHYTFVDYATQGYIALVGLLLVLFHNERVPGWRVLIPLHFVVFGLVHALIVAHARRPEHWALDFLRHFYPVLLYTGLYRETGVLNEMFVANYLDPYFIQFEQRVFGFQPSLAFMNELPQLAVSEVFYAAYFSYYVMIVGVGLALFLRDRRQFYHYVSVISFVFYCCYLAYIFLPVSGPRLFFREVDHYQLPGEWLALGAAHPVPETVTRGIFYRIIAGIYAAFEPAGAAMPSSHVAVALCTVWFSFRYLPRIRYAHLTAGVLLCGATVYCRFHYVVDVLAGIVVAAVLLPVANRLYALSLERLKQPAPQKPGPFRGAPQS